MYLIQGANVRRANYPAKSPNRDRAGFVGTVFRGRPPTNHLAETHEGSALRLCSGRLFTLSAAKGRGRRLSPNGPGLSSSNPKPRSHQIPV